MSICYDKFINFIKSNSLILPGDRILLSLSAGKDSMAMLHLMLRLRDEFYFETGVFHLNHLTRGEESDADEYLIEDICRKLEIPFYKKRIDINAMRPGGTSFEEYARDTRYMMLQTIASDEKYTKIATAHNMDDNVETILMRIFSGTGIKGLKGISITRNNIIRPMLHFSKDDIYSYLEENRLSWREDSSNLNDSYKRNYIRLNIIPGILKRFSNANEHIINLSLVAAENESLLDTFFSSLYPDCICDNGTEIEIMTAGFGDNIAAVKYILAKVLYGKTGVKLSRKVFNEIIRRYLSNRSNIILYNAGDITISRKYKNEREIISISSKKDDNAYSEEWSYFIRNFNGEKLFLREIRRFVAIRKSSYFEFFKNRDIIDCIYLAVPSYLNELEIRNRRNGDRIDLEFGSKKIKDLLIEKKLDSDMKKKVPIILVDNVIAAVATGVIINSANRIGCNFLICKDSESVFVIEFSEN